MTDLSIMVDVALLATYGKSRIILFSAVVLRDDPVVLESVERNFTIDMRHMPVQPCAAHLIIEAIDVAMPSPPTNTVPSFN